MTFLRKRSIFMASTLVINKLKAFEAPASAYTADTYIYVYIQAFTALIDIIDTEYF